MSLSLRVGAQRFTAAICETAKLGINPKPSKHWASTDTDTVNFCRMEQCVKHIFKLGH